ncbi:hypothetical protein [Marinimicrobium sp. ABcell2]|uniref:hypothetical protein n=1 Tax=Marinimicrobium sp. ABcell2 TaxID=3069751 RepID=UPI0027B04985|nr:hypothetical protein [Marinimicrobium sp. ABcell2]MDQ2076228.1 hypothetical protein [Marinimicrobium sp. ABcell2]
MNIPIFSQAAIFRLQQLAGAVHKHSGVRHKLSEPNNLLMLLRYASQAPTPGIAMQYQAFIRILNRTEKSSLQARGVPLVASIPAEATELGREAV